MTDQHRSSLYIKQITLLLASLASLLVITSAPISAQSPACTITVTSNLDNGDGAATTLREAMQQAETSSNADYICFSININYQTIVPNSELPMITKPVTIDGLTQPRSTSIPLNRPVIEIAGVAVSQNSDDRPGIYITSANVTIRGLSINRFEGDGIISTYGVGSIFEYNNVGTNSLGTINYGNGRSGIGLQTSNNIIRNNLVSGNLGAGIAITGTGSPVANNNTVISNMVGTNAAGTASIPNGSDGILLTDAGFNTVGGENGVTPGGACTGDCNLFSGNGANGIGIQGVETLSSSPTAVENTIIGNYVGVNINGDVALPNFDIGFEAQDAPNNTIGGIIPQRRNIFSGNNGAGVSLTSTYSFGNKVQGNYIGVGRNGISAIPNKKMGVNIGSPFGGTNNAHDNIIGGTQGVSVGGSCTGACNVISGNLWSGIFISGGTGGNNQIVGNFIGSGVTGGHRVGNVQDGIGIRDSSNNRIGGPETSARNLISGNGYNGVVVIGISTGTRIEQNYIGMGTDTGCMPNNEIGIALEGGTDTAILRNGIYCNGKLAIDIGPNNVSQNDTDDLDAGPNNTQNFPVIYGLYQSGSNIKISGGLDGRPNTKYRIDAFASPSCDSPYSHGEGKIYLGSTEVTSNSSGDAQFSYYVTPSISGVMTLTATKFLGATPYETSELSACTNIPLITVPRQHPDGTVVKDPSTNAVYLIEGSQKRRIGSPEVMNSQNYASSEIKSATSIDLGLSGGSGVYFKEGTLIKGSGHNVYVIDQTGENSYQKRLINSLSAFTNLGYSSADIYSVPDTALQVPDGPNIDSSQHPDGTLIKASNNPTVYFIESSQKKLVGSPTVFTSQRFRGDRIKTATTMDLGLSQASNVYFREGSVVKGSSSAVYVVDFNSEAFQKRLFSSTEAFIGLGYSSGDIIQVSEADLPYQDGSVIN